jgi:signal transduction histidine kinase
MRRMPPFIRGAVPIAALSAVLVALILGLASIAIDLFVAQRLTGDIDQRIAERIETLRTSNVRALPLELQDEEDRAYEAPLFIWRLDASGKVVASSVGSPVLPAGTRVAGPSTLRLAGTDFRVSAGNVNGATVVVGQTLASVAATIGSLSAAELVIGPALVVLIFFGTLLVGWRIAGPVERARRRQLAFTADASHELRTPLSVIEAETSLALGRPRDAASYRATLTRIQGESDRLHRTVDDLLMLARIDALPPVPAGGRSDLVGIAAAAVQRFQSVAADRSIRLEFTRPKAPAELTIPVPAEWTDRVLAIVLDNACRYSPDGGHVEVQVQEQRGRAWVAVDDSGPGIPPAERLRIFDRFHRATERPGGAGLGLAIADAIVRASNGRWEISDAPIGGARIAISWPLAQGVARPTERERHIS